MTAAQQLQADEAAAALPMPPQPVIDVDSAPFWEAAARGELALCRCTECRRWMHPPLERCRYCAATTGFEAVSGRGSVHSFIVVRHASVPGFAHLLPYAIVMIGLEEGIRLTGRLTGDPSQAQVGSAVQARSEQLPGSEQYGIVFDSAAVDRRT